MKTFSARLVAFFSDGRVWAASLVLFVLFMALVMPRMAASAASYSPEGSSFDLSFFYTPDQALSKAEMLGPEGRAAYVRDRWTYDLAFPVAYGFFALSSWGFALRRLKVQAALPLLVPVLAVVFDLAENTAASFLCLAYGAAGASGAAQFWALAASIATPLKWIFIAPAFGGSIALLALAGIVALRGRLNKKAPA